MSINRNTMLLIGAITAILITGVVLSQFSSGSPDGLEYVAEQQ
ncbi:MAG: PDGLE domain-containing protein, partial [Acidimicrobiia bacterium]